MFSEKVAAKISISPRSKISFIVLIRACSFAFLKVIADCLCLKMCCTASWDWDRKTRLRTMFPCTKHITLTDEAVNEHWKNDSALVQYDTYSVCSDMINFRRWGMSLCLIIPLKSSSFGSRLDLSCDNLKSHPHVYRWYTRRIPINFPQQRFLWVLLFLDYLQMKF